MHTRNKLILIIILMISILSISRTVLATDKPADNPNFSFNDFENKSSSSLDDVAQKATGTALDVVRAVGTGISLIMLAYIGIKYMMASPEGKADVKKSATIYIVGAVLVFAATNIIAIIAGFASNVSAGG